MSPLALYLLGAPRLERDGARVHITRRKVMAWPAYLAVAGQGPVGQPHSREGLVTLVSLELDSSRARALSRVNPVTAARSTVTCNGPSSRTHNLVFSSIILCAPVSSSSRRIRWDQRGGNPNWARSSDVSWRGTQHSLA
jgi:hypothetical protein